MVVPASTELAQALTKPLEVVQDEFVKNGSQANFTQLVHERFAKLFDGEEVRSKVPLVSQTLLRKQKEADQSSAAAPRLVRWRCMVQDTNLGNEVLARQFRTSDGVAHNGLFGATSKAAMAAVSASTSEASNASGSTAVDLPSEGGFGSLTTMCGVSIPGQSRWSKRHEGQVDEEDGAAGSTLQDKLPRGEGFACLLKLYDEELAETLQVAQVVDVLGILDQSALPSADWTQMGGHEEPTADEGEQEQEQHPTIHVVSCTPILQYSLAGSSQTSTKPNVEDATRAQQRLTELLAEHALAGDKLAAQWTLLAIIARIHTRAAAHTLGTLSLNLSGFPSSGNGSAVEKPTLFSLLGQLVALSVEQPLNLQHLDAPSTRFSPKSDADERGLRAGRLQLVQGTLLLIDESTMNEGQLKERGINNIRTLSEVLTTHKLSYAFPFSSHEMDTDLPCIVVSQGKSFLPNEVQVPLVPTSNTDPSKLYGASPDLAGLVTADELDAIRSYLVETQRRTSQSKAFTISADVSNRIQDDFVEIRKANQAALLHAQAAAQSSMSAPDLLGAPSSAASSLTLMDSQEDLNRVIQVARLICLSKGYDSLRWEDWQEAKTLDHERQKRLSNV